MPALWALTVYKGVRGFSFVPLDAESFEIYLHGSKKRIAPKDGEYDVKATPTTLPEKNILDENGVTIKHNYGNTGNGIGSLKEHAPIHFHVRYKGKEYKLFASGAPLKDSPLPPKEVLEVMSKNKSKLQRIEKRIGKWYRELPEEVKRN